MEETDQVVLLPGIMGSILSKGKKGPDLWKLSIGAILHAAVHGRDLRELALSSAPGGGEDDIVASGLLEDATVIPGFWKVEGYDAISTRLKERYGPRFTPFPYDWRRDNRLAAQRLKVLADQVAPRGSATKLVLIGHSMGGLVARYFAEVLGGWEQCRAILTIGTPHRGSVDALGGLVNGIRAKLGPVKLFDITQTLRTFTSVYQLLPLYPCVDMGGADLVRVIEAPGLQGLDPDQALAAFGFHREIERAVHMNMRDPAYRSLFPLVRPLVGISQPTNQMGRLTQGGIEILRRYKGVDLGGDGTVPRVSATPWELSDEQREVYIAGRHSTLQNLDSALDQIEGTVSAADFQLSTFRGGRRVRLGLDVDDAFLSDEPLQFTVLPSRPVEGLEARILNTATGGEAGRASLRRLDDGSFIARRDPLPTGTYSVTVEGEDCDAVRDVFSVLAYTGADQSARRNPVRSWSGGWSARVSAVTSELKVAEAVVPSGHVDYVVVEKMNQPSGHLVLRPDELDELVRKGQADKSLFDALGLDVAPTSVRSRLGASLGRRLGSPGATKWSQRHVALDPDGVVVAAGEDPKDQPASEPARVAVRQWHADAADPDTDVFEDPFSAPDYLDASPGHGRLRSGTADVDSDSYETTLGERAEDGIKIESEERVDRNPTIESPPLQPGEIVDIRVDLRPLEGKAPEEQTISITAQGGWKTLEVHSRLSSEEIDFALDATAPGAPTRPPEFGPGEGKIVLGPNGTSEPATIRGRVRKSAAGLKTVEIVARFYYQDRISGAATARLAVQQVPQADAKPAPAATSVTPHEASVPSENQSRPAVPRPPAAVEIPKGRGGDPTPTLPAAPRSEMAGAPVPPPGVIRIDTEAESPVLTIELSRARNAPNVILWHLRISRAVRDRVLALLPRCLDGESDIGANPADFVTALFTTCEQRLRGEHRELLQGAGQTLYSYAPRCFVEVYEALVRGLPDQPNFPVQIVTDEPYIPWELMRVPRGRGWAQLGVAHPVARWLGSFAGWLRSKYPAGRVVVIAPVYPGVDALPHAQEEARYLKAAQGAAHWRPADHSRFISLLEFGDRVRRELAMNPTEVVSVFHFAGHGEFGNKGAAASKLHLENNGAAVTFEVMRAETMLGRDGALAFLNACQVGRQGALLGSVGGWAAAFIEAQFGGVVAPLWSVHDDNAYQVMEDFYHQVRTQGVTVAEAMRRIRIAYGDESQTFASYIYYGDVMARFALGSVTTELDGNTPQPELRLR